MNTTASKKTILAIALSLGLCGHAVAESGSPLTAFIEGDVPLEPHPDLAKVYRYLAPGMDLKRFDRVMFTPIEIWLHQDSEYKGIDAAEIKSLTDRFLAIMQAELEPEYPVVSKPGAGVAIARLAISGVKLKKKERGPLGYTPVGFLATSAMEMVGKRMSLVDGTIEAEVLDGASNQRIAILVDFSFQKGGNSNSWSDIEARLRLYAKRFRNQLDQAHGRQGKTYADVEPSFLNVP